LPGNMENPWGILSKHYLLICPNTNACDWHFRVVGGEPSSNFGCEITILTAFFIVFCSPCRKILCWYIRIYQTVPQVHHQNHLTMVLSLLQNLRNLYSIKKFLNMQTDQQKTNCTVLHFYVDISFFFMLMFHFYLG
jgi:hypothetical protein